jgi:hypothetical protein
LAGETLQLHDPRHLGRRSRGGFGEQFVGTLDHNFAPLPDQIGAERVFAAQLRRRFLAAEQLKDNRRLERRFKLAPCSHASTPFSADQNSC